MIEDESHGNSRSRNAPGEVAFMRKSLAGMPMLQRLMVEPEGQMCGITGLVTVVAIAAD